MKHMRLIKPIKSVSNLNRKKRDPFSFVFTGNDNNEALHMYLFRYTKDLCEERLYPDIESVNALGKSDDIYWLNIVGLSDAEKIASICDRQGIHKLTIQDILDVKQRPKFQEYDDYSFLTIKSIVPSETEMISEQISFVLGTNHLISFQERKADYFEHLRIRLRENKGIVRERTADYLLYAMLEAILDNYFKTLSKLDDELENYNFSDTRKEPLPNALVIIESQKKFVHFIKKSILPIKEFTQVVERGECQYIDQRHVKYFLEIKDLCLTLIDNCDMILSSLESATNLFFSVQGHRMNQVVKTLTIVSTIFIPLTFIAGIYGMNFTNMPELDWQYGYFGILAIMSSMLIVMVIYFKWKKWF